MNVDASGWSGEGDFTNLPPDSAVSGLAGSGSYRFSRVVIDTLSNIGALVIALDAVPEIGLPDFSDGGMLQYLRTERILQRFQTRGFKLIELVRIYQARATSRRDG